MVTTQHGDTPRQWPATWDDVAAHWIANGPHRLWRQYHDTVVQAWLERWLLAAPPTRLLKTDLFEEAMGTGVIPTEANAPYPVVGIDISEDVVAAASRHPNIEAHRADVRALPFADGSFDCVVSTSTLDHFDTPGELSTAVAELVRVLRPSGQLLLTLDNLSNPTVWLRNALPTSALRRVGLAPYRYGVSCTRRGLHELLERAGFRVTELTTILHCPRAFAVHTAGWLDRNAGALSGGFLRALAAWETLERWPSRFRTGNYLAARAVK